MDHTAYRVLPIFLGDYVESVGEFLKQNSVMLKLGITNQPPPLLIQYA